MPPLFSSPAWQALVAHRDALAPRHLRDLWDEDPGRGAKLTFSCAGIAADFSKQRVTPETLGIVADDAMAGVYGAVMIEAMVRKGDAVELLN